MSEHTYAPRDWGAHPPYLSPAYKSTPSRAPTKPLVAPGHEHVAILVDISQIAGTQEAVGGHRGRRLDGLLVVARHQSGAAKEQLPALRYTELGIERRDPDAADLVGAKRKLERTVCGVLGHAPAFGNVQTDALVPAQQVRVDRRRAATEDACVFEPEVASHSPSHPIAQPWDGEQQVQFALAERTKHALAEQRP